MSNELYAPPRAPDSVLTLFDAATLWLLFTGPAKVWFRTRGGRIAPP